MLIVFVSRIGGPFARIGRTSGIEMSFENLEPVLLTHLVVIGIRRRLDLDEQLLVFTLYDGPVNGRLRRLVDEDQPLKGNLLPDGELSGHVCTRLCDFFGVAIE